MPLFEYVCGHCGLCFERLIRSRHESVACPRCQASDVEKQPSTFAMSGVSRAASGSGCGGCSSTSCGSCHGH